MKWKSRSVSIRQLPEIIDGTQTAFCDDLENCINVDRPSVVLDGSKLRVLDRFSVHFLLCCLEQAMKRNGDIRLAALQPEARDFLHSTGVDSLFQCFETLSEAVESYQQPHFELFASDRSRGNDAQSKVSAA